MTEPSVGEAVGNLRQVLKNFQTHPNAEVSFSHEGAFDVTAHIRTNQSTGMQDLVEIDRVLTTHGFDEVNSDMFGTNEWAYEWSEDNY